MILLAVCITCTGLSQTNFAYFLQYCEHTLTDTHIPTLNERQKGMAGLTDQFPISPSRPAVIRSSCTWREAWIPLGFISSNYPLLPPHAVLSLPILYFTSGYWHCPLLPLSNSLLTHFCLLFSTLVSFCSRPRDEMDSRGLFQIVFLTQAGKSMRTTEKAKSSREQLFTPSLCSFVPPLPSAAFGSESALVLLAVTVCQGANRFLLTGASGGQVWVFHYFLYQVGIIWVRTGLSVSLCVGAELGMNRECVY